MNLVRRNLFSDFDRLFPTFFTELEPRTRVTLPRVVTREEEGALVLEAEVPGLKPEDVTVTFEDGLLTIAATAVEENTDESEGRTRTRRFSSGFTRRFRLPKDVDTENIDAKLADGLLEVTLPKNGKAAPRTIAVH